MKASLRSIRIAPKKANLVAGIVRGMRVKDALDVLERTPKKAARIIEALLNSALANASHNESQNPDNLVIKALIVNQGSAYHRGVPMSRGRVRPIRKFMSHIDVVLGIGSQESETKEEEKIEKDTKKTSSSVKPKTAVKKAAEAKKKEPKKTSKKSSSPSS